MGDERDAGKGRILVVDDEELNRILLSTSLQEAGYTVETAEDGQQALEMLSTEPTTTIAAPRRVRIKASVANWGLRARCCE